MREHVVEELSLGNTWADAPAKIGVSSDEFDVRTEGAMEESRGLALQRDLLDCLARLEP